MESREKRGKPEGQETQALKGEKGSSVTGQRGAGNAPQQPTKKESEKKNQGKKKGKGEERAGLDLGGERLPGGGKKERTITTHVQNFRRALGNSGGEKGAGKARPIRIAVPIETGEKEIKGETAM